MSKSKTTIVIVLTAFILFAVSWFISTGIKKGSSNISPSSNDQQTTLSIVFDNGITVVHTDKNPAQNQTVMDLLEEAAGTNNIKLSSARDGEGILLVEIAGQQNSESKKWTYSVNGEVKSESPDTYMVNKDDKIEWKFISAAL